MSDIEKKEAGELAPGTEVPVPEKETQEYNESKLEDLGINDAGVIPKGTLDPVYEQKARVLNHAVSMTSISDPAESLRMKGQLCLEG
jgi:hypothetical protein